MNSWTPTTHQLPKGNKPIYVWMAFPGGKITAGYYHGDFQDLFGENVEGVQYWMPRDGGPLPQHPTP